MASTEAVIDEAKGSEVPKANLPKLLVGEFKNFFTELYGKLETYEASGVWPETKKSDKKHSAAGGPKLGADGKRIKRNPTVHNLFIRETIARERLKGPPPTGMNFLTVANQRWKELSPTEQKAYAESKKDELELNGGNIPPTALKAKEPPAAAPATASKAPPTAAKRKAEVVENVDGETVTKKEKKKKKKKKSEVPPAE